MSFFDSHGGGRPETYAAALAAAGGTGGCLQGMPGVSPGLLVEAARGFPGLLPIPAWPAAEAPVEAMLDALRDLGVAGLHLHPRACGAGVMRHLPDIFRGAAARDLAVFFCSYAFAPAAQRLPPDPLPALTEALAEAPGLRLVLLHGGGVDLLRHAEFTRANPGVLLDLSFTLMKYAGSSIDLDISFLARSFDRRLCLGSDFPDYAPAEVLARFDALLPGLAAEKRDNILGGNLRRFLHRDAA
ncbi:amidohydrolase family protein [Roseomonas sp. 18066]|uniref:amidohydrolase family protein n=1 Tax=Roseomonas sp. 18066 TaxID=2681412 RepID=UPI00135AF78F|nr:amidohydrolase family protein [Roseomonas sp. 18066]